MANTRSKEVALAIVAIPGLLAALGEIAERAPVPGYGSAGALLLRLVGTQTIARAALGAVKGGVRVDPHPVGGSVADHVGAAEPATEPVLHGAGPGDDAGTN